MRSLEWNPERSEIILIDQRLLPGRVELVTCCDAVQTAAAIRDMVVRGAPVIGVTAAFGMAMAALRSGAQTLPDLRADIVQAGEILIASRPTAVNLPWAVNRMKVESEQSYPSPDELRQAMVGLAIRMAEEDVEINRRMALHGAGLIQDGDTIIHHCNTGALATVDWGTALGAIRMAHQMGKHVHVLVDETRPRLQGARLTAWELEQYGIPYEIISDNAAGYFLHAGKVQKVMFGADRVAANGDVANKIGSYMLALAAHSNNVAVYSVFPTSTIDLNLSSGDLIPIEERDPSEVLSLQMDGQPIAPKGARARNPAFDITPNSLITALVTENGVVYPPFIDHLPGFVKS